MTIVKENLLVRWFVVQISRSVVSPRLILYRKPVLAVDLEEIPLKLKKERTGEKSLDGEDVFFPCLKTPRNVSLYSH